MDISPEELEVLKKFSGAGILDKVLKNKGFKKVLKALMRIIDSALGIPIGLVGGALVGAGEGLTHGVKSGVVSLATDPWTVSYDYSNQSGVTTFGQNSE